MLRRLKEAIANNTSPSILVWEILTKTGLIGNYLGDAIVNYRETWLLLTSPEGKRYIKEHLDELLAYWEKLARELT